jgi:hypothetical protein
MEPDWLFGYPADDIPTFPKFDENTIYKNNNNQSHNNNTSTSQSLKNQPTDFNELQRELTDGTTASETSGITSTSTPTDYNYKNSAAAPPQQQPNPPPVDFQQMYFALLQQYDTLEDENRKLNEKYQPYKPPARVVTVDTVQEVEFTNGLFLISYTTLALIVRREIEKLWSKLVPRVQQQTQAQLVPLFNRFRALEAQVQALSVVDPKQNSKQELNRVTTPNANNNHSDTSNNNTTNHNNNNNNNNNDSYTKSAIKKVPAKTATKVKKRKTTASEATAVQSEESRSVKRLMTTPSTSTTLTATTPSAQNKETISMSDIMNIPELAT